MTSLYTFSEYSSDWPLEFEREAARLRSYLHDVIVTIHHIGSTSVPGLAGKPVIDLLPVVSSIQRVDELTPLLEKEGYRAWGEYGLPDRRFFTRDRNSYRTHNIHIYPEGHLDIVRHLAFSAYLRYHEAERCEYETVKRAAYTHHPANIQGYMDEKDGFIRRIETVAFDWYKTHHSGI